MRKRLFTVLSLLSLVVTGCSEAIQHSHKYEIIGDDAWTWVAGEDVAWKSASVTFTCGGCDESTEGHSFTLGVPVTSEITLAPTCETTGTKLYTASIEFDGKTYKSTKEETISAIGHKASECWSFDQNSHWHACENEMCQSKLDEANHTFKTTWSSDSSKHWHECEICGYKTDVSHHVFSKNIVTKDALIKAADCTHDAVYYKSCVCGAIGDTETFVDEGSALGHDMTKHNAVSATCENNGKLEYYTCSREPGVYYKDINGTYTFADITEIVVGAIGHKASEDWSYDSTNHWHTCENDGCNERIDEEAHTFEETWHSNESQHWHQCEECEYKTDVSNHTFDQKVKNENTLKSEADCTNDAVYYKSCVCGKVSETETFVDEGSSLGHDMTKHDMIPPKYNENGVKEYYTCSSEPGVYYTDKDGTDTFTEEELIITPGDWIFEPGDEFGFNWSFDKGYGQETENLPFLLSYIGYSQVNDYIKAVYDSSRPDSDDTSYINLELLPFYPNAAYDEDGQFIGPVVDQLCMIKPKEIILYMTLMPNEFLPCISGDTYLDNYAENYDFETNSYHLDLSDFSKTHDFLQDPYIDLVFGMLTSHCSDWPEEGTELQTFGVELIGELIEYEGATEE